MESIYQFRRIGKPCVVHTATLLAQLYDHPDLIAELTKRLEIQADSNAEAEDFVRQVINDMYADMREKDRDIFIRRSLERDNLTKDGE